MCVRKRENPQRGPDRPTVQDTGGALSFPSKPAYRLWLETTAAMPAVNDDLALERYGQANARPDDTHTVPVSQAVADLAAARQAAPKLRKRRPFTPNPWRAA